MRSLVPLLLGSLLLSLAAHAGADGTPPEPEAIAAVRTALAEYDQAIKSGGADTVAAEKAVLAAGLAKPLDGLVEFLAHERFGPLVLHVLCAHGGAALEGKVLGGYLAWPPARRAEGARDIAGFRSGAVRGALKELSAVAEVASADALASAVRAARVRAGDEESLAALEKLLASKEVPPVVEGLLLTGDARATALLSRVARLLDDKRPLPEPLESQWPETQSEATPDGGTTSRTVPVLLTTVGDVALEAANRLCATTLPEWVAWWYEPEKGARFGRGADGTRLLRSVLAEDAKAAKANALRALDAIEAVLSSVRVGGAAGEHSWRLVGVKFDKRWTISGTLDGKPSRHTVSQAGDARLE